MDHPINTVSATNQSSATTKVGRKAEELVSRQLAASGYHILAQNWRRREVELDIIASKRRILYIFEVKYRRRRPTSDILATVNSKKLAQLRYGAKLYRSQARSKYVGLRLVVVAVAGPPMKICAVRDVSYCE